MSDVDQGSKGSGGDGGGLREGRWAVPVTLRELLGRFAAVAASAPLRDDPTGTRPGSARCGSMGPAPRSRGEERVDGSALGGRGWAGGAKA